MMADQAEASSSFDKQVTTVEKSWHETDEDVFLRGNGYTRFFDSTAYRCCFSIFHAKIGTFVVVTLVFHEIIIGILYLLSRDELKFQERNAYFLAVLACRILQLPFSGIIYVGLWLQKRVLLLPFAISQLTIGAFADIATLIMLIKRREEQQLWLLFTAHWRFLNIILPLIIYAALVGSLMLVLHRCSIYFRDRRAYEQRRKEVRAQDMATVGVKSAEKFDELTFL